MRTAKTLIRLGGCPGWSESSLGAQIFCWFCHVAAQIIVKRTLRVGPNLLEVPIDSQHIRAIRMKKACVLSYPLSAQRRLWSDWADAQADLSLRWAHPHFVGFVMSRLVCGSGFPTIHVLDSVGGTAQTNTMTSITSLSTEIQSTPDASSAGLSTPITRVGVTVTSTPSNVKTSSASVTASATADRSSVSSSTTYLTTMTSFTASVNGNIDTNTNAFFDSILNVDLISSLVGLIVLSITGTSVYQFVKNKWLCST